MELFLARRDGKVVGRIAAVDDPHYNEFHGTKLGFFGMFECIDDVGVSPRRSSTRAADWVQGARGFTDDARARSTSPPTTSGRCWSTASTPRRR